MSYTKQTWQTGDVITADKLNHMEDGIAGDVLYVKCGYDNVQQKNTVDKTYAEIKSALDNDIAIIVYNAGEIACSVDYTGDEEIVFDFVRFYGTDGGGIPIESMTLDRWVISDDGTITEDSKEVTVDE